jgi:RNA polymerase-binding transcription factor DksA
MILLILNEKSFVEDCLSGKIIPSETKITRSRMIGLLSAYYDNDKQNTKYIIQHMEEFYQDNFLQEQWLELIERVIRVQAKKGTKLIEREYIPIYQSDIDTILSVKDEKQQKVLFSMYVLARYRDRDGWIGLYKPMDIKHLFDLADVKLKTTQRYLMLGELEKSGFVIGAQKNDNINEKVNIEHDETEVMRIIELEHLGNQFLDKYKTGWKMCERCGKMIKLNVLRGRPKKYCSVCSMVVHKEKDREYQMKKRARID